MGTQFESDESTKETEREERRIGALDEIGFSLEKLKEEAVLWRAQYEVEWTQDYDQYNTSARQHGNVKSGAVPHEEPAYRQSADNITRPKVIVTASRLGDMLFPTNEANWALEASPKPDLPPEKMPQPPPGPPGEDGQPTPPVPFTPSQLAVAIREVAGLAADGMQTQIKDQLEESRYSEQGRAVIFDACLYGTGVLRGPVLKTKRKHTFKGGGYNAEMVQQAKPTVEYVDLWSFFPQPSRNIRECEHAFRLHVLPKRAVRALAKQPGFDSAQIARLLEQSPVHGAIATGAIERGAVRPDAQLVLSERYTVWEYRGPMPKTAFASFVSGLVAQGMLDEKDMAEVVAELDKDHLNDIDCEVWFSQGVVIKMALSLLANGDLGYYVFNYEKDPSSIFGRGVAFLCRDDQHATNQLWQAMMLNSMMSAGPQIGVRKGSVMAQPGDGRGNSFTADKPRVWALNDEVEDINKVFSVFVIPNVTDKIMGLYERSKANADEHTMTPMIAQGEPTQAVPTSSGTAMLMNAANVVMRRLAKGYDDDITVPMITGMYDWNMAFNPDEDIKGDYCIIPKGASHLLIKDVAAQHLQFATQLFSSNPILAPYMKPRIFANKNIEMLDLTPAEMLFTDDEMAENARKAGEQPDPEVLKAQAAIATAEAAKAKAEAEIALTQHKIQWEREERQYSHVERMADTNARKEIQLVQLESQKLAVAAGLMKMDSTERIAMQKIIAQLTESGAKIDLKQYEVDARTRVDAEKIVSGEAQLEREIEAESKNQNVKVQ